MNTHKIYPSLCIQYIYIICIHCQIHPCCVSNRWSIKLLLSPFARYRYLLLDLLSIYAPANWACVHYTRNDTSHSSQGHTNLCIRRCRRRRCLHACKKNTPNNPCVRVCLCVLEDDDQGRCACVSERQGHNEFFDCLNH